MIRIGTAGWAIPRQVAARFSGVGPGLNRYAGQLNAAEINTTFYRRHLPSTFIRWAAATPQAFRFAVKAPKAITHDARLVNCDAPLAEFLDDVSGLAGKLGPLIIQLPPSFAFDAGVADRFFGRLRSRFAGPVACEPRHASWFDAQAGRLLADNGIARVAADPACVEQAAEPGGDVSLAYFRWHGSPRVYFSDYGPDRLAALGDRMRASNAAQVWCIFDNTGSGAAASNALALKASLGAPGLGLA